ncbi:MAG: sporulation protein [Acidimicrobiia bacterium]|nr:sporulation protein [Acidimicrobiia bacterium]
MSKLENIMAGTKDAINVNRVFGEPFTQNGVTVIPAASIRGGAGGGDSGKNDEGSGSGFGLSARPVGAYQVKGDELTWVPAADTTRMIILSEILAIVAMLVLRSIFRSSRKTA